MPPPAIAVELSTLVLPRERLSMSIEVATVITPA